MILGIKDAFSTKVFKLIADDIIEVSTENGISEDERWNQEKWLIEFKTKLLDYLDDEEDLIFFWPGWKTITIVLRIIEWAVLFFFYMEKLTNLTKMKKRLLKKIHKEK